MTTVAIAPRVLALALAGGVALGGGAAALAGGDAEGLFRRVATFPVFLNTDVDDVTVAEIVAASGDGNTLVYTDGATENIGFIDITDPANPIADGVVAVGGEPTSVAVAGPYVLTSINTSVDLINTSGDLVVIDLETRAIEATIPLGGQPDAIAVSPDGQFAAIAIENERDEDLGNGEPPQLPAGFLVIVELTGDPSGWTTSVVDLVGVPDLFPEDPEPEFVDINANNQAVVTLQENNHLVIVDLATGAIVNDFSAGVVDLDLIDTVENDLIEQIASLLAVPREPDAAAWIGVDAFATADEGDLFGGSRGFTVFSTDGSTLFEAGNSLEHLTARLGHYPEGRSENKGNEPEGVDFGVFAEGDGDEGTEYLFVGSERSSVVAVYELGEDGDGGLSVEYLQVLPTTVGPEGLLAIPGRDLFVVSAEEDARDDKIRSTVSIYARNQAPNYPSIVSADGDVAGVPIPWAALSGLVTDPDNDDVGYTVYDSFYQQSRIFEIDLSQDPAVITDEIVIRDTNGVLLEALNDLKAQLPGTDDFDPAAIVNAADNTVNLDPEGVVVGTDGSFGVASEGAGNLVDGVSDPEDRPFESPSLVLQVQPNGDITLAVLPPLELVQNQFRFGFEGIAADEVNGFVYVAFQRAWPAAGDPAGEAARIGRVDFFTGEWTFAYYPLDAVESPNGGWVGLSEITLDPDGDLVVLERDNQGNTDAAVKRIYQFDPSEVEFLPNAAAPNFNMISKRLVRDLLAEDDFGPTGGLPIEKLEGLAVNSAGDVLVVNDNDGVDDNSGETQLFRFEGLLGPCEGDVNGDGQTDSLDLNLVLAGFGDEFDSEDLNEVLGDFGCQ